MLERPFQEVLESGQPDFPFALCWANESWFRRWQGSKDEMLMEQTFSEEDDVAHIRWLIECFKDPRYIRINGRPLLAVYRALSLRDPAQTVEIWRRECARAGVERPWLVLFETGESSGHPALVGFDASAEFVPHRLPLLLQAPSDVAPGAATRRTTTTRSLRPTWRPPPSPGCGTPAWRLGGTTPRGGSPERPSSCAMQHRRATGDGWPRRPPPRWRPSDVGHRLRQRMERMGQGAHLEPDAFWGRAYLEVTKNVLRGLGGIMEPGPSGAETGDAAPTAIEDLYHDLYEQFVALQQSSSGFLAYAQRRLEELQVRHEAQLAEARREAREIAA